MARTRTNPETRPTITTDRLMQFGATIAYNANGTPDTDNIDFFYVVNNLDADGDVVKSTKQIVDFKDWPATFKSDIKAVRNKVLIDATARGLMGSGTDTDDMP